MLNIARDGALTLPIDDLLGESVAVLGIKGSGKSNTAAVIAEELLGAGLPLCIVDIAGEYWGLKEKYQVLVAGRSANVDVETAPSGGGALAEFSLRQGVPVILDLSGFRKQERFDLLLGFFERLWDLAGDLRRPYQIALEEAHNFVPQGGSTPVSEVLVQIATEGRKRGLGIVMVSQRSARVDKNALTQAGILFLHRVRHPTDIAVYRDIVPKERGWVERTVNALQVGQAIALYGEDVIVVTIRQRHTFHAGYTPGLGDVVAPDLRAVDASMLDELRRALESAPSDQADPEREQLRRQLAAVEAERDALLAERDALKEESAQLKSQIEMLSQLRVTVENAPVQAVEALAVESIHAQQLIAPNGAQPLPMTGGNTEGIITPEPRAKNTPLPPVPAAEPYRSPLATARAVQRQERRFESLLRDLDTVKKHERRILAYLVERDDLLLSVRDLARYVGYSESTLAANPPTQLLRMGLLRRSGKPGHFRYAANARERFGEMFPDLDVERLCERLLKTLGR
jgi:hypothetical protein